jgi:hypothetical protein
VQQIFSQDDIAIKHTQWIYVSQIIHILQRNLDHKDNTHGIQSHRPKYESNHVITCVEEEHGRNHLITGH